MSKDKRKKKFFQGMEHLRQQVGGTTQSSVERVQATSPIPTVDQTYLRGDLLRVVVLMSVIILLLVGLTIIDKKTDKLVGLVEAITSIVIK